jgi:homoserine O-acetyltransferase
MVLGINSDYLFPLTEQKVLAYNIPGSQFITIDSEFGHDGFLLEFEQIKVVLDDFLK